VDVSGRGRAKGEGEGGGILWMNFVYLYKNITMKPVEIVLRRGRGMRKNDGGDESN
jgi:hypothetical protein